MSAPGPAPGSTTNFVYLNSFDRYSNGQIPRTLSNQTTCADITYSMPGLSNVSTVSVGPLNIATGTWNQLGSGGIINPQWYNNIIYLVDYTTGTSNLVTIPVNNQAVVSIVTNLSKYVAGSTYGGSTASTTPINIALSAQGTNPQFDVNQNPAQVYWTWYDTAHSTTHSLGWAPVTTAPDGTNIANRRQLYDILGLQGHVPSTAGLTYPLVSTTNAGWGYTVELCLQNIFNTKYIDVVSPQLQNFASDVSSGPNPPSNLIQRVTPISYSGNLVANTLPTAKVMKVVPGSSNIQIRMLDDTGTLLPTRWSQPIPAQTFLTGTGISNTTTSNLTFSGMTSASTTFPVGSYVAVTPTSAVSGFASNLVYQVQSSTSNSVSVYYNIDSVGLISNATTFIMAPQWQYNTAGNMNGPEYNLTFYATSKVTTQGIS